MEVTVTMRGWRWTSTRECSSLLKNGDKRGAFVRNEERESEVITVFFVGGHLKDKDEFDTIYKLFKFV